MKEIVFRFYLVFVALRAFFLIMLEQLFNKSAFFCSVDKVTAVDLVCLRGSEKMNSNKLSVTFIRIVHLTACIDLSRFVAKKEKK